MFLFGVSALCSLQYLFRRCWMGDRKGMQSEKTEIDWLTQVHLENCH